MESDTTHPLLGLLGIVCGEDLSQVSAKPSSLDEWQKEARKLELQGKQEQADAIRQTILRVAPVPWPVLSGDGFRLAHARSFAPRSVYGKAKQHLFEFAAFHGLGTLCAGLTLQAGYKSPRPQDVTARFSRERAMAPYLKGEISKVIADVDRYGLEHRSMMGMTPLMMAADVGDVPMVERLLERGARIDAVDALGRTPIHFALRRAFNDATFAEEKLGALYELLCPTAIEIEVDGRRLRLARSQGEFVLLLFFVARFHELFGGATRRAGFTAKMVSEELLSTFPRSVVPESRRRRVYWNGVFARAEVDSTYKPTRKLWQRERMGHYVPSEVAVRVAGDVGKADPYVPLVELLGVRLFEVRP